MSTSLTPKIIAEQLGTNAEIVISWIHAGQLGATDVSAAGSKRPTWRIDPADLAAFLESRRAKPPAPVDRNRRRAKRPLAGVKEFF